MSTQRENMVFSTFTLVGRNEKESNQTSLVEIGSNAKNTFLLMEKYIVHTAVKK